MNIYNKKIIFLFFSIFSSVVSLVGHADINLEHTLYYQRLLELENLPTPTFYVSADGVDERPQLQALDPASVYIGAYSIGGRMIVSRYGDGLLVLRGNQIEHAYPETGGWPKIREYGGVIYAIGTVTMVSFDKGASFQRAPGSPYFANDLIAFDNKVQLISNGSIYESTDGGHNFHLLVGKLE